MKRSVLQILCIPFIFLLGFQLSCSQEVSWDNLIKKGKKAYYANRLTEAESLYLQALEKVQEATNNDQDLSYTYFHLLPVAEVA